MKRQLLSFLILTTAACCICLTSRAETLNIAAAANLQPVLPELQAQFESTTGHKLQASYGASGKFVAQIENGAPFDVFMSADTEFPAQIEKDGYAGATPRVYAYGLLVLWSMKNLDWTHWQRTLQGKDIVHIAVANPKTAPYGREAMALLKRLQLDNNLQDKLVFAESIGQTNQYIQSAAVDVGFTAKSTVMATAQAHTGFWIDMPRDHYAPIAQAAVLLKYGKEKHEQAAQAWLNYLNSPGARAIFERNGYLLP